jgi:hypothetical protein
MSRPSHAVLRIQRRRRLTGNSRRNNNPFASPIETWLQKQCCGFVYVSIYRVSVFKTRLHTFNFLPENHVDGIAFLSATSQPERLLPLCRCEPRAGSRLLFWRHHYDVTSPLAPLLVSYYLLRLPWLLRNRCNVKVTERVDWTPRNGVLRISGSRETWEL